MRIEVLMAWPGRHEQRWADVPAGARVADALARVGWSQVDEAAGLAIHGLRASPGTPLREGDRIELLRPLEIDPKEARRRRAASRQAGEGKGRG